MTVGEGPTGAPGVEHDFRRTYWGHSWYVSTRADGTLAGLTHCTPTPRVGDTARWRTNYGEAVGRFTAVKGTSGVDDLFHVEIDVIERLVVDAEGRHR